MQAPTANISISGRIDPDSYIDFALAVKKKGWDFSGGGYKSNGSISLIVVAPIPDGCNSADLIDELWKIVPKFDGIILTADEIESLSDFQIEEDGSPAPPEEPKWW